MKQWYYKVGEVQTGPVGWEDIVALVDKGALSPETLVWQHQLPRWTPFQEAAADAGETNEMYRIIHDGGQGLKPTVMANGLSRSQKAVEPTRIPFSFTGSGSEYFRIWLVNTVLTILTFGLYAAWAKIRRLRYYHGHTHLDGHTFDFVGKPIPLLKGNLLFGSAAVVFMVLQHYAPIIAFFVGIGLYCVAPLLIVKSLRFRARNTVYRNVRFAFWGLNRDAYKAYIWIPMLVGLSAGIMKAYSDYRKKLFTLGNFAWGDKDAEMGGDSTFFYVTMFKSFGLLALATIGLTSILGLSGMFSPENLIDVPVLGIHELASHKKAESEQKNTGKDEPNDVIKVNEGFTIYRSGAEMPAASETNISVTNTGSSPSGKSRVLVITSDSDPLNEDGPWADSDIDAYEDEYYESTDDHDADFEVMMNGLFVKMWMMLGVYLVLFFVAWSYYQIRILNYSINNLEWKSIGRMESTVRFRDLLWIYFTNMVLTVLTLGLFSPWARVRLAKYRAAHTFLLATGSMDQALDTLSPEASALGDAGADIFDFDIAF